MRNGEFSRSIDEKISITLMTPAWGLERQLEFPLRIAGNSIWDYGSNNRAGARLWKSDRPARSCCWKLGEMVSIWREVGEPWWRKAIAVSGFVACTASVFLLAVLAIHGLVTGGFPFDDPTLVLVFRLGFLTALFGLIAGVIGNGSLQKPSLACSAFVLFMWALQAATG
jgi:hypothetical protein